jgi:hypothetical protein
VNDYYERLGHLRDALNQRGTPELARALLITERSASTSGDVISATGVLLRQIRAATAPTETALRADLDDALALGQALWDQSG